MICISLAQESRRLVLADMLNAANQADLLEVRLDRFGKSPDIGELLTVKPRPVIMTCRRPQDGGQWDGSEEERLAILRQCIISKADYVEIELDAADQVRPYPPAKRVISYTNLQKTPPELSDIYEEALTKRPDVVKLTTLARTPEEAWPLVQILASAKVPTVAIGLGKPGIMLAILGRKVGAPWTYAALERGMESYPGQPTVTDLKEIYHYEAIGRQTRLIGVTGFGDRETATVALLNAALAHHNMPARCVPLGVGDLKLFSKVIDAAKLAGVVVDGEHQRDILRIAKDLDNDAQQARAVDLILHKGDHWRGYRTLCTAVMAAIEEALKVRYPGENPLQGRQVMIVGINDTAQVLARRLQARGGAVVLASHKKKAAQQLAQELQCRFVQFEALYGTMHDVLLVCDEEREESPSRSGEGGIHPGYLKPGMVVVDLTADWKDSLLIKEAAARGCITVPPLTLFLGQTAAQAWKIIRKDTPPEVFGNALPARFAETE